MPLACRRAAGGRYYKMANRDHLEWARGLGFVGSAQPIVLELYSRAPVAVPLPRRVHGATQPPDNLRERVAHHFDPPPFWYAPLEWQASGSGNRAGEFPCCTPSRSGRCSCTTPGARTTPGCARSPRNWLYVHPATAQAQGIADGDWVWLVSPHGRIRVQARHHDGTAPGTVWTWNAIGKRRGAWALAPDAPESRQGLLNHVISDVLGGGDTARPPSNSDR